MPHPTSPRTPWRQMSLDARINQKAIHKGREAWSYCLDLLIVFPKGSERLRNNLRAERHISTLDEVTVWTHHLSTPCRRWKVRKMWRSCLFTPPYFCKDDHRCGGVPFVVAQNLSVPKLPCWPCFPQFARVLAFSLFWG